MPNAIISVYDKTNLSYLGHVLRDHGFIIYATPGTRDCLLSHGISAKPVEEIAGNPSGFENYVSSLGFKTMIGTLADNPDTLESFDICPIDLVVYNFVHTWDIITNLADFNIQHVDLGGPTIVKAAAINFRHVLPIVSPEQYCLLEQYPNIPTETRIALAKSALEYCADYDRKLSSLLSSFQGQ